MRPDGPAGVRTPRLHRDYARLGQVEAAEERGDLRLAARHVGDAPCCPACLALATATGLSRSRVARRTGSARILPGSRRSSWMNAVAPAGWLAISARACASTIGWM